MCQTFFINAKLIRESLEIKWLITEALEETLFSLMIARYAIDIGDARLWAQLLIILIMHASRSFVKKIIIIFPVITKKTLFSCIR